MGSTSYDYGARFYDPVAGRWWVVDPMIERHFSSTPFHYTFNNPVNYTDPYGLDTTRSITPDKEGPIYNFTMGRVIIKPETKFRKFWRKFSQWWNSGNDPTIGKYYEKKNRDSDFYENYLIKNTYQQEIQDLYEAFGDARGHPTNRNTVNSDVNTPEEVEAVNEMVKRIIISSDQEINQSMGGNTDAHGKPLDTTIKDYNYRPNESDSMIVPLLHIDMEYGDSLRDWKIHKGTRQGRPVSEPYFRIKRK